MRNENRVCYSKNLNENLYLGTVPWYALRKEPPFCLFPPLFLFQERSSSEKFFHFSTRGGNFLRGSREGEDIRGIEY